MKIATALLAALLIAPAAHTAPVAARAATATQDWSTTVTRTPAGAFVMGNPKAKVRLVEYASMTCSHCAAFAAEGIPALRGDYVRRGLVSLEFRHAVRDGADLAASMLARCAGPRGYFASLERIFAAQDTWLPRAAAVEPTAGDTPAARDAALMAVARGAGLAEVAQIKSPAVAGCIGNRAEQATLGKMSDEAWGIRRISGTPAFLINDKAADGATWDGLAPQIAAALR